MFARSIALLVCLGWAAPASAQPVRVYVFVADNRGGYVDEDATARAATVADLQRALQLNATVVQVHPSRRGAELIIELRFRGALTLMAPARAPVTYNSIRVDLGMADARPPDSLWAVDAKEAADVPPMTWTALAERLSQKIVTWVVARQHHIPRTAQRATVDGFQQSPYSR